MIYKKTLIDFHGLHFRGRKKCPLKLVPEEQGEVRYVREVTSELGLHGEPIDTTMQFWFDNEDTYDHTWAPEFGYADVHVEWNGTSSRLGQNFRIQLQRLYTREYWQQNWIHHNFNKNRPELLQYGHSELLKRVFCPTCDQSYTYLMMPYDDIDAGWQCEHCWGSRLSDHYQRRMEEIEATNDLIELFAHLRDS